ncbi:MULTISPECIES: hypothetical protein [Legionella]|uniref:Uncharacterized protein n=1 Tax=Legionella resiliens TaxID=2905958 RepID=A0ABS8WZX1_9GAMM|nr:MULTISPECIES: hypothetical protein [unclassified Legionella]MCE0722892.1 hypothetical protein [Legionella sp. 9fVS26]MCE3532045.1 hypothetical protein [Legionella sp. 8cVS16]QLZ68167.1 hypothetical protein FOLKNPGA_00945 [Legionella sp. PC1000]
MKGIMKMIVLSSMFVVSSHVMADNATSTPANTTTATQPAANTHPGMWICTTNASSPTSGSPDEQADEQMSKHAASGSSAFDFALKNCRDCTKITCELQTKPTE